MERENKKGSKIMEDERFYHPQLQTLAKEIGDWRRAKGFKTGWENMSEKLLLVHSEVSEAAEALRTLETGKMDEFHEELADILIRVFDICDAIKMDIPKVIKNKMDRNAERPIRHGKKF